MFWGAGMVPGTLKLSPLSAPSRWGPGTSAGGSDSEPAPPAPVVIPGLGGLPVWLGVEEGCLGEMT